MYSMDPFGTATVDHLRGFEKNLKKKRKKKEKEKKKKRFSRPPIGRPILTPPDWMIPSANGGTEGEPPLDLIGWKEKRT